MKNILAISFFLTGKHRYLKIYSYYTMPYLKSSSTKGSAFSRANKLGPRGGAARQPPPYKIKGADQIPSFHIRPADDKYEQQADRIAEKITAQLQSGAPVKRSTEKVKPLKEGKGKPAEGQAVSAKTAAQIAASQGKGQPLPAAIRIPAEKALGRSLAKVRLHTGAKASALNREVGAEAFAVKKDIFMGNKLDVYSPEGQELALHEAVHTQQQKNNGSESGNAIQRVNPFKKKKQKPQESATSTQPTLRDMGYINSGTYGRVPAEAPQTGPYQQITLPTTFGLRPPPPRKRIAEDEKAIVPRKR